MTPSELIRRLMEDAGLNTSSLAAAMGRPKMQGQIHRFINGHVKKPSYDTAERFAKYFDIPANAVYNAEAAKKVAEDRGLKPGVYAAEPVAVYRKRVIPAQTSLRSAVLSVAEAMTAADPTSREAAIVYMKALLGDTPQSPEWVADRVSDALSPAKQHAA